MAERGALRCALSMHPSPRPFPKLPQAVAPASSSQAGLMFHVLHAELAMASSYFEAAAMPPWSDAPRAPPCLPGVGLPGRRHASLEWGYLGAARLATGHRAPQPAPSVVRCGAVRCPNHNQLHQRPPSLPGSDDDGGRLRRRDAMNLFCGATQQGRGFKSSPPTYEEASRVQRQGPRK